MRTFKYGSEDRNRGGQPIVYHYLLLYVDQTSNQLKNIKLVYLGKFYIYNLYVYYFFFLYTSLDSKNKFHLIVSSEILCIELLASNSLHRTHCSASNSQSLIHIIRWPFTYINWLALLLALNKFLTGEMWLMQQRYKWYNFKLMKDA